MAQNSSTICRNAYVKDTAKVLGIENVPNVPFTVVIDVNKEVKPFYTSWNRGLLVI